MTSVSLYNIINFLFSVVCYSCLYKFAYSVNLTSKLCLTTKNRLGRPASEIVDHTSMQATSYMILISLFLVIIYCNVSLTVYRAQ